MSKQRINLKKVQQLQQSAEPPPLTDELAAIKAQYEGRQPAGVGRDFTFPWGDMLRAVQERQRLGHILAKGPGNFLEMAFEESVSRRPLSCFQFRLSTAAACKTQLLNLVGHFDDPEVVKRHGARRMRVHASPHAGACVAAHALRASRSRAHAARGARGAGAPYR